MDKTDPAYKGQSGYNPAMLAVYDLWVLGFMSRAVLHVPVPRFVELYRANVGHRHLDVGPGTGYAIEKAAPPPDTEITLLDPNPHVLHHCEKRLAAYRPTLVEADVMKPLPVEGPFDSVALYFVIHCLRGPDANKAIAIRNIADVLGPEGVLFGGTISGWGSSTRSPPGRSSAPRTSRGASTTWATPPTGSARSCPSRSRTSTCRCSARRRCSRPAGPACPGRRETSCQRLQGQAGLRTGLRVSPPIVPGGAWM